MSNLNHSVDGLVGFALAVIVISSSALGLRVWSRGVSPNVQFSWDDWLCIAALPPTLAICALIVDAWRWGLGTHWEDVSAEAGEHMLKDLFAGNIMFDLSISFSKISALAFYGRIFRVRSNHSRAWRWSFYSILGLAIVWPLASIPYVVAQCMPVSKYWDPSEPGNCFGQFDSFVSSAISSVCIDIMVLVLPLPQIFQLQMEWMKKTLIILTLIVGYGAAFMSIGRLVTTAEVGEAITTDVTYAIVPTLYWSIAECGLSVVAVCLPAIFQLFKRVYQFGPRSLFSSRDYSTYRDTFDSGRPFARSRGTVGGSSGGRNSRFNTWRRGTGAGTGSSGSGRRPSYKVDASFGSVSHSHEYDREALQVPLEAIHIRNDVRVGSHQQV